MLDVTAVFSNVAIYLAGVFVAWVLVCVLLRFSNYYRLKKCPVCGQKLSRQRRTGKEKWLNRLSLGILSLKRYRCYSCYWEGQAFEIPKGQESKPEGKED
jgi:uncharacterized protein with PIN domain